MKHFLSDFAIILYLDVVGQRKQLLGGELALRLMPIPHWHRNNTKALLLLLF
jgi:quercetin dioxygenase-like cupin family protein